MRFCCFIYFFLGGNWKIHPCFPKIYHERQKPFSVLRHLCFFNKKNPRHLLSTLRLARLFSRYASWTKFLYRMLLFRNCVVLFATKSHLTHPPPLQKKKTHHAASQQGKNPTKNSWIIFFKDPRPYTPHPPPKKWWIQSTKNITPYHWFYCKSTSNIFQFSGKKFRGTYLGEKNTQGKAEFFLGEVDGFQQMKRFFFFSKAGLHLPGCFLKWWYPHFTPPK